MVHKMSPAINLDSAFAKAIGFTSDKFAPPSYLWKSGKTVYISLIGSVAQGRGDFSRLLANLQEHGFKVKVPTPSNRMRSILEKKGFTRTVEVVRGEGCDVWVKAIQ